MASLRPIWAGTPWTATCALGTHNQRSCGSAPGSLAGKTGNTTVFVISPILGTREVYSWQDCDLVWQVDVPMDEKRKLLQNDTNQND